MVVGIVQPSVHRRTRRAAVRAALKNPRPSPTTPSNCHKHTPSEAPNSACCSQHSSLAINQPTRRLRLLHRLRFTYRPLPPLPAADHARDHHRLSILITCHDGGACCANLDAQLGVSALGHPNQPLDKPKPTTATQWLPEIRRKHPSPRRPSRH